MYFKNFGRNCGLLPSTRNLHDFEGSVRSVCIKSVGAPHIFKSLVGPYIIKVSALLVN